ncbi:hypothetical protein AB0G86_24080 [Streptomyces scabiei]|uniref:hypothetical protein n=1 Tax=Streptomyces TaxID=1883 RepID=UPI0029AF4120|nr:hypothetical protein [Streptomyces sp. ND04-05B]MDX3069179.1 hypothetical protein [Streptomyces sp. ND04-05B]
MPKTWASLSPRLPHEKGRLERSEVDTLAAYVKALGGKLNASTHMRSSSIRCHGKRTHPRGMSGGSHEALGEFGGAEVGVWTLTTGAVRDAETEKVFVVLAGDATVRFDTGDGIGLTPGLVVRPRWLGNMTGDGALAEIANAVSAR